MPFNLAPADCTSILDRLTTLWHQDTALPTGDSPFALLLAQLHRANFDLWHEEDKARDTTAGDPAIATAKRNIDRLNQQRNDLVEQLDRYLLQQLEQDHLPASTAPLHTETPGMVLDRLSILSLKCYHTQEEISRANAPVGHAERNRERLALLQSQRSDIALALTQLWQEVLAGHRSFKLYRQFKMYNDPTLNPVLYGGTKK